MFWFNDARLMHNNPEYSRAERLRELGLEVEDRALLLAYDDILKFNNWANEYNYIIQVFRSIQDSFLGGTESDFSNEASWLDLFKKYDADGDGLLNKAELRVLIRNTQAFKKATDAETDFIYRLIASSG